MCALDEGSRARLVGYVEFDSQRPTAIALDPLRQLTDAVDTARAERDRRALGGERQRSGLADPRRGAGDRRDAALERAGHQPRALSEVRWASSTSIRTPQPVGPLLYGRVPPYAVPAMSTCTQGRSSTNWRRNSAA